MEEEPSRNSTTVRVKVRFTSEERLKLRLLAVETLRNAAKSMKQIKIARTLRIPIAEVTRYITTGDVVPSVVRSLEILRRFKAYVPEEVIIKREWIKKALEIIRRQMAP